MKELISVVLPIFNVEEYLSECVNSVISQRYKKLEIILVDDGSTDSSGIICDELAKTDERIKVIHKKNGGLSDARNTGLKAAKGEYITFIDSDDIVSDYFIEQLYTAVCQTGAEVACCKFTRFNDGDKLQENFHREKDIICMNGKELIQEIYNGKKPEISFIGCAKLYKRDLFIKHNILYPYGRLYEDTSTTYKLLYFSGKTAFVDEYLYYYRMRTGSITNTRIDLKRCRDGLTADYSSVCFFRKNNEKALYHAALNTFYKASILTYKTLMNTSDNSEKKKCKTLILKKYKAIWRKNKCGDGIAIYKKALYMLFQYVPYLVCCIYK